VETVGGQPERAMRSQGRLVDGRCDAKGVIDETRTKRKMLPKAHNTLLKEIKITTLPLSNGFFLFFIFNFIIEILLYN
jgi:hypothetical protein